MSLGKWYNRFKGCVLQPAWKREGERFEYQSLASFDTNSTDTKTFSCCVLEYVSSTVPPISRLVLILIFALQVSYG